MSSEQITLFDLPSRAPCKCWSLNPWKSKHKTLPIIPADLYTVPAIPTDS